jgi:hypothetical protein
MMVEAKTVSETLETQTTQTCTIIRETSDAFSRTEPESLMQKLLAGSKTVTRRYSKRNHKVEKEWINDF